MNPGNSRQKKSWVRHVLEQRSASAFGLAMIVLLGLLGYAQAVANWALVVIISAVVLYEFQKRLDQGVPLLQLTSLLAVLQWLVGPVLNYSSDFQFGRYSMYVDETTYFQYAVPATCVYVACMLVAGVSIRQRNLFEQVNRRNFVEIGILLNAIGLGAAVAAGEGLGSVAFLFHLLSQLRYVGALYFLFSRNPLRLILAAASCTPLLTNSLGSGMFHDLILWAAIIFCYWFAQRKWTLAVKLLSLTVAATCLFTIQVIKQDYRKQLRAGLKPAIIPLALEYVTPGGKAWGDEALSLVVTRLNQGWIISAVMKHVPAAQEHADGETISDAVSGAFMPRIIFKNKKTAGGRDNFRKYTGLEIQDSTSMGISPLGEAYANFGVNGGIVFMFAFGLVFALIYRLVLRHALKYPTFLFWVPLIFYQAIKAETEMLVVLNQLTKGGAVAFACHFLLMNMVPGQKRLLVPASPPAARR